MVAVAPKVDPLIDEIRRADAELARLARSAGPVKLRCAEVLEALFSSDGHRDLGFSSIGDYVEERCGFSGSWGRDLRKLAERLRERELHRIRGAIRSGKIGWSMADLLSRHATADTEEALLAQACVSTVRAMHMRLAGREPPPEEQPAPVAFDAMGDDEDRKLLGLTRMLMSDLAGAKRVSDEKLIEGLLGEATTTLLAGGAKATDTIDVLFAMPEPLPEPPPPAPVPVVLMTVPEDGPLPATANELDRELVEKCRELARRNLRIGRLAQELLGSKGWEPLGYASEAQYARERLNMSPSSLQHCRTLAKRVARYPALERAIDEGAIGCAAALDIGRLLGMKASSKLVDAWIDRAKRRTVKHLREELEAVSVTKEMYPNICLLPPTDEDLEAFFRVKRKIRTGELAVPYGLGRLLQSQTSVTLAGRIPFRLSIGLHLHYQEVEALYRQVGDPNESFLHFLCRNFWHTWINTVFNRRAEKFNEIYERDLFVCTNPVCTATDVKAHHMIFRIHGGTHASENLTSLCVHCHLQGVHVGRLAVDGPASHKRWKIGTRAIMIVHGREKVLLTAA